VWKFGAVSNGGVKALEETGVTTVRDRSALELGTPRRRRYSPEQKKAILAEAAAPGTTVTEVSRRHQITRSLIHNWRRQEAASLLGATVRFTPVRVPAELAQPKQAAVAPSPCGRIEIALGGDVCLRLEGPVDEESLRRVVRVLRR
jgi:transposase